MLSSMKQLLTSECKYGCSLSLYYKILQGIIKVNCRKKRKSENDTMRHFESFSQKITSERTDFVDVIALICFSVGLI